LLTCVTSIPVFYIKELEKLMVSLRISFMNNSKRFLYIYL